MSSSLSRSVADLVSAFTARLHDAIEDVARGSARALMLSALGGETIPSDSRAPRSPGRRAARTKRPARRTAGRGQKRDPKVLAATTEKLAAHITKHPGQRMEQIAKTLGTSTGALALSVKRLSAAGRIKTRGQKRATSYFPASGSAARATRPTKAAKPAKTIKAARKSTAAKKSAKRSKPAKRSVAAPKAATKPVKRRRKTPKQPKMSTKAATKPDVTPTAEAPGPASAPAGA